MMSIDEAIAHAREKAKEIRENIIDGNNLEPYESYCIAMTERCAREHEQLAEWLELLKWYEQGMEDIPSESGVLPKDVYHAGYNKAIDDFAEKLKSECREHYIDCDPYFGVITDSILYEDDIEEIAEQLKAGGKE